MYKHTSFLHKQRLRFQNFLQKRGFFSTSQHKEWGLLIFFSFLIAVIILRLFYLQVREWNYYRQELTDQHSNKVDITPKRGGIYVYDDAWQAIALATNANLYNLFVDPKFIWDTERVADILTPALYTHLCELHGLQKVTKEECIGNIEDFTKTIILPRLKVLYYSDVGLTGWLSNSTGLQAQQLFVKQQNDTISGQRNQIITNFSKQEAISRIREKVVTILTPGKKDKNYLWFFESPAALEALSGSRFPYISIENGYYVYILPNTVRNTDKEAQKLSTFLAGYWYNYSAARIKNLFAQQDTRYAKIADWLNATIAEKLLKAKDENYKIKSNCQQTNQSCEAGIPLLHGIWLEKTAKRYYPLGDFAANILGYVAPEWNGMYGIEQFFDSQLKWIPGQIQWLSTPWIGEIGSNDVSIMNPVDGEDIYLTIKPYIQKKVENLMQHYIQEFSADSIAVLVMDPFSGDVVASANYPTFNPNAPQASYALKPLTPDEAYIIDDDSRVDIPIYYVTGNELQIATYNDRKNPSLEKYVAKNLFGAQVFVDKNIAFPYEPGSIMKPFTVAAWLDSDEISLYDFYDDPQGQVKIDLWDGQAQFIRNADERDCAGTQTFLHALIFSCNVGMVKIAEHLGKESFFNYMQRLWFGEPTNIELAGEDAGFLDSASSAAMSRFYNTAFWQWILATPIQIAAWYSTLVNGWHYVKPRIVDKVYNPTTNTYTPNPVKIGDQILKPETSDKMKDALFQVVYGWLTRKFGIPWYTLWGKTGTSQISFKWIYRSWDWWTNASFVWVITKENLKYIVVIQVRRPRNNQYWEYTAWKIFGDLSKILIERDLIQK